MKVKTEKGQVVYKTAIKEIQKEGERCADKQIQHEPT